jgi:hypothetical protein
VHLKEFAAESWRVLVDGVLVEGRREEGKEKKETPVREREREREREQDSRVNYE